MDIKTFVFFDLETTGLPDQENNDTKITELCLIAIQSDHIKIRPCSRIQNKINICFNPRKAISPISAQMTGLTNQLLECQLAFKEDIVDMIKKFINLQQQPVCLIAHNGNTFDFPILRAEVYKAGCELAEDILCIDSLLAFRELHEKKFGRISFKLKDVYKRLTSKKAKNLHRAENDVNMLIESAAVLGDRFVLWSNLNAKRLCDIPMMQPGRKIGT